MPPELAEVHRWLEKADRDRRTADAALRENPPITDTAAFHCQQAAEKLLKAFLIWKQIEFEKTHDLRALIELCAAVNPAFLLHRDAVESLTPYAIRFRYPGPADPTITEVRTALKIAQDFQTFVGSLIR